MHINAVSSAMPTLPTRPPEALEGSKHDHDGDAEDKAVGNAASSGVSAAVPKGVGGAVDTNA